MHRRVIRQYPVGRSFVTIVVPTLFVETSYIEHVVPCPLKAYLKQQLNYVVHILSFFDTEYRVDKAVSAGWCCCSNIYDSTIIDY